MTPAVNIHERLGPLRRDLLDHPVYDSLRTLEDLRRFMSHHVFAVWDFMSLVKALQRSLTCVDVPWLPIGDPLVRRLINEIVLGEESDRTPEGGCASHFELYLRAMTDCGADTRPVMAFLDAIRGGGSVPAALASAPQAAAAFVGVTWDIVESGSLASIAGAFAFGREDVIPAMFTRLVRRLDAAPEHRLHRLLGYLERHIEVDAGQHGPMAVRMLERVCGEDLSRWGQAEAAAERSLRARLRLWDAVVASRATP